jgi:hypothetical protein
MHLDLVVEHLPPPGRTKTPRHLSVSPAPQPQQKSVKSALNTYGGRQSSQVPGLTGRSLQALQAPQIYP